MADLLSCVSADQKYVFNLFYHQSDGDKKQVGYGRIYPKPIAFLLSKSGQVLIVHNFEILPENQDFLWAKPLLVGVGKEICEMNEKAETALLYKNFIDHGGVLGIYEDGADKELMNLFFNAPERAKGKNVGFFVLSESARRIPFIALNSELYAFKNRVLSHELMHFCDYLINGKTTAQTADLFSTDPFFKNSVNIELMSNRAVFLKKYSKELKTEIYHRKSYLQREYYPEIFANLFSFYVSDTKKFQQQMPLMTDVMEKVVFPMLKMNLMLKECALFKRKAKCIYKHYFFNIKQVPALAIWKKKKKTGQSALKVRPVSVSELRGDLLQRIFFFHQELTSASLAFDERHTEIILTKIKECQRRTETIVPYVQGYRHR